VEAIVRARRAFPRRAEPAHGLKQAYVRERSGCEVRRARGCGRERVLSEVHRPDVSAGRESGSAIEPLLKAACECHVRRERSSVSPSSRDFTGE
jgi:hypothetical protein